MPPSSALATVEQPSTALAPARSSAIEQLEKVVLQGNLKGLTEGERIAYYARVCESLGLNPLTRPFEYIELQGKLTLYARKDATDQLRQLHGVNIVSLERERTDDLQIVTCTVRDRYGREDSAIGAVSIKGLTGEAMANALMKAETKSKRRATLSVCGLGWMDEVEAADARAVEVAPRQSLARGIAARTAALEAASDPGESDASVPTGGAEVAGVPVPPAAGSPACAHDPKKHQATDAGVVCGDCGTVIAAREAEATKPRSRARTAEPKKAGDDGYWRARAHAIADERGLDPDAVKRIAGDVLGYQGDWSRKDMVEADWEQVAGVIEVAPVRMDDDQEWKNAATVFAGNQAIAAGIATKLATDADWEPVDASAAAMFSEDDAEKLDASDWSEYGLRVGAKA